MDPEEIAVVGSIAEWMASGGDISLNALRPQHGVHQNALLEPSEWAQLDDTVLEVFQTPLVGIDDLISAGLTHDVGGLGTILSGYEQMGNLTDANISIDGVTEGENDAAENTTVFVPIPIIHKDFSMSLRKLLASRKMGEGLDVTQARLATTIVRRKMESMLFNGVSKNLGAYPIYGYTTAPNRITGSAAGDFGTPTNGYKTFVQAIIDMNAKGLFGPFQVYIAPTQYGQLLNLISTNYERNELEVIRAGIPDIKGIKPSYTIVDGSFLMVQMTSDVVDLAIAEDVTPVQWAAPNGMTIFMRIMAAMAPRIKTDANGVTGVLHYTGA